MQIEFFANKSEQNFDLDVKGNLELSLKGFRFHFDEDLSCIEFKFSHFTIFAVDKKEASLIYTQVQAAPYAHSLLEDKLGLDLEQEVDSLDDESVTVVIVPDSKAHVSAIDTHF